MCDLISASLAAPFKSKSVRTPCAPSASLGLHISFQIKKSFVAVLQETAELIFKRSGYFLLGRTESAGKRTVILRSFRAEGLAFSLFLAAFEGTMSLTAVEIISFMEIAASLAVMVETILLLFLFPGNRLGLFDGQGNLTPLINGNDLHLHLIFYLKIIIHITYIFVRHFGNVNQTHLIIRQFHECAKLCDTGNGTFYDITDF